MSTGRRWNTRWPKGHPQGGKFRPKLSQSVRVSSNSISYNVGYRVRVAPKVAVYGGALLRVERVRSGPGVLERAGAKLADRIESRGGVGAKAAASLITQRATDSEGIRITRSRVVSSPSLRVSNAPAMEARRKHLSEYKTTAVRARAPRARKPRAPRKRQPNAKAITSGKKVAA